MAKRPTKKTGRARIGGTQTGATQTASPRFMISNRNVEKDALGRELDETRYFECPGDRDATSLKSWIPRSYDEFSDRLRQIADDFVRVPVHENEKQQHVSLFVHGFNVDWQSAVQRYLQIKSDLFDASDLGTLILFTWPSNGSPAAYLPDREDARKSADAVTEVLVHLNDYLVARERLAARTNDPNKLCQAKLSVIAHSMGNYVMQKALAVAAKRLNSPQLISLINQLVMVAADVDNDIFQRDKPADSDGSLVANLCYRIAGLYTGLDQVLGASAGLKHFGTRRLGRSGLADRNNVWDNVFDLDVSPLVGGSKEIHSAVFESKSALGLLERILRGVDRGHLFDNVAA